jgi:plastocyanin
MPPMSMGIESIEPSVSIAGSPSGPLRCAVTPDATASATIEITTDELGFYHFGAPVSIEAGQAVAFNNGNAAPHTITEGTYGVAVDDPCVNEPLAQNASVTVTFYEVGEYPITCRPHPVMQTAVTVQ